MLNEALLRKTMEKIEELPAYETPGATEVWRQDRWISTFRTEAGDKCGTAGCFAGWAAILNGAKGQGNTVRLSDKDVAEYPELLNTGPWIGSYARIVLGLTSYQAEQLFHYGNTKEDLRRLVNEFIEESHRESTE